MKTVPPVTLIIPVYNVAGYIGELLESIAGQTFGDYLVIIGDDGSTDGTESAVRPFLEDPRINYLKFNKNRGLGAVMKDLMSRVTTPYWCNPGGDDRLHPHFLAQRLAAAAEVGDPILVHGTPRQIDSKGREIHHFPVFELPKHLPSGEFLDVLLYHNVVNNPGVMVSTRHTRLCLDVMRTDLQYAPDWYWWILHSSLEGDIVFDPEPCMDYRYHSASLSGSPAKKWIRAEEVRRVPLLALHDAANYSQTAADLLERYGHDLERLWFKRMIKVLAGTRGRHRLPDVPWLPAKRLPRALKQAKLAIGALRLESAPADQGGFIGSGYTGAGHGCLRVSMPQLQEP
jgi:glycosyltransferase involved in cell wall biosynthesis